MPGEQHVDESALDQLRQIRSAAGVNDDRAGDDGNLLSFRLDAAHHLGDACHGGFDAPLRRHLVGHEREAVAIAILERRHDADAFDAADDGVALA